MARPLKRRHRPNPRKVTVRYADPDELRAGKAPDPEGKPKRVDPKYFEQRAELRWTRARRAAVNIVLRPGDEVTIPERGIPGMVWEVTEVDAATQTLRLVGTVFGTRQPWAVKFEDAVIVSLAQDSTGQRRR